MKLTQHASRISAVLAVLAAVLFTASAPAQSESELRRENDALRARIGQLEAELEASQDRIRSLEQTIARLEAQIERLRRTSSGSSEPAELEPERVTIDESEPTASPRALFRALQDGYRENLGGMEIGSIGDRNRDVYLRAVDRWASSVNREYRQPITWTVRISDAATLQRGVQFTVQAVDPVTDVELGDSFPVLITNRTLIRRLEMMGDAGQLFDQKLEMKGVLIPDVRVNRNRESEGAFNTPPFIGPFAEFYMGVEAQSIRPASEAQQDEQPEAPGQR